MRLTEQQRHQIEARIRAAMDRLLRGDLPPAGRCDTKTLAAEAAVNAALRERLADRHATIAEMRAFRTAAVSQLAAQHEEILRLRQQITDHGGVRVLHPKPDNGRPE